MKKIVISVIIATIALIAAFVAYILNADWAGKNKDNFVEQFYNSTGKFLRFDGKLAFSIFPTPHLQATNVKIFNDKTSLDQPLAEINNLDAKLALKPLINGEVEITKMELLGAVFNIDWDKGFHWQEDLSSDQRQMLDDKGLILNSAVIKDGQINFESANNNISFHLSNLNGEVSAESMLGPFHMEGNYINGTSPEGFAITIGRLSEVSATPLNLAVSHPSSNSYLRFDGSFQNTNNVLNGSIIIESDDPAKFINANFPNFNVSQDYKEKAALGFDLAFNSQNLSFSNIVIKYGDNTSGSGNLQIPLNNEQTPIQTTFDFVDIDINSFANLISDAWDKIKNLEELSSQPLKGALRVSRAHYNQQQLRKMTLNFEYSDKRLTIQDSHVLLPGNTNLDLNAELFPAQNVLNYRGKTSLRTDNLLQTLQWLQIFPPQVAPSVYKNLVLNAGFSGNLDRMQISPFSLTLDKTSISGEAGLIFGDKKDIMIIAQADTINFDNYIAPLPDEIRNKNWLERVLYRFAKTGLLNKIDLVLDAKADLIIYENMPFESVSLKGNVLNKIAELEYLNINKVANTSVSLKGKLYGFGDTPQFDNFNYNIKSSDLASLINKLELKVPPLDYKRFNFLNAVGNLTGKLDNLGVNTITSLGNLQTEYAGKISYSGDNLSFNGDINIKHPDFNQFLANIQSPYVPEGENLGLFQLKSQIAGVFNNLTMTEMDMNIGATNIRGNLTASDNNGHASFAGELQTNRLDIKKFLPQTKEQMLIENQDSGTSAAFLPKPQTSSTIIDYAPYKNLDITTNIKADELVWYDWILRNDRFDLAIKNGTISITNFSGIYNDTPFQSDITVNTANTPSITWKGQIRDALLNNFSFGGKVYNLREGTFSGSWDISSSAESLKEFWHNLQGNAQITIDNPIITGFDFSAIYDDLLQRESNVGLSEQVHAALKSGSTKFKEISASFAFENSKFKISNTKVNADNLNIEAYGEGDLNTWTMNMGFNSKFDEPLYLPNFSFMLKDDIANPTIDVDVSPLFKFYQSKVDQKQAEIDQAIKIEKKHRRSFFNDQKKITDELIAYARNSLEKDIDAKAQNAYNDAMAARYASLKQNLNNTLASLAEQMAMFANKDLTDEDIKKADDINNQARASIQQMADDLPKIYLDDVKSRFEGYNQQIVEEYNFLKQLSFNYNKLFDKYNELIVPIQSHYSLEGDETFQQNKDEITTKIAFLEQLNQNALNIKNNSASSSSEDYEQNNQTLASILAQIKSNREELQQLIANFDRDETAKIDQLINHYNEIATKEENARLIKENTGSISIKKTGQTVKISRDLDEIKDVEEQISQDKIRVLDFSKPKLSSPQNFSPRTGVVKKGGNLIAN